MDKSSEIELLLARKRELEEGLPFLYAFGGRTFQWRLDFYGSLNRMRLLAAANQIGKSTTAIQYVLTVATHPEGYKPLNVPSWNKLWPDLQLGKPLVWYLYPDGKTVSVEFETKWKPLLPKGSFKDHPKYGWKIEKKGGVPFALRFNSGVNLYFKTYGQGLMNLQSSSVHLIITDEELPEDLYPELSARTTATKGYFIMVFTATLGQEIWRRAMEEIGTPKETFKDAYKRTISMYDCMFYTDGSRRFTEQDIAAVKRLYPTDIEIQRRVYGRFVLTEGLVYSSFSPKNNVVSPKKVPKEWLVFVGIDIGSGGRNHSSAISFVAVRPDFKKAYLFKFWKGDDRPTTTNDVANKYLEMSKEVNVTAIFYDWHAKDFENVAMSKGIPIQRADKSHEYGEGLLNSLFKNQMLDLFDLPEVTKLVTELTSLKRGTPKHKANDDGIDSCFTEGHKVATNRGLIDIKDIEVGDKVWTRKGFKKVVRKLVRYREVDNFKLGNNIVTSTPDHNIILHNGKKWIKDLTESDTLIHLDHKEYLRCLKEELKRLSIKELLLGVIQTPRVLHTDTITARLDTISEKVLKHSIKRYGKTIMGKFQKGIISIIKTVILQTIILKTWLLLVLGNICPTTLKNIMKTIKKKLRNILIVLGILQQSGTSQKRVNYGISNTQNIALKKFHIRKKFVNNVVNYIKQNFQRGLGSVLMRANLNGDGKQDLMMLLGSVKTAEKSLRPIDIPKQKLAAENVQKVYNLTVEDQHEYYLEGVLVANCRYAVSKVPFDFSDVKKEKKEVKEKKLSYREKMFKYGRLDDGLEKADEFEEWNELYEP